MFVFKIGSNEVKVRTDAEFHALNDNEKFSYVIKELWLDDWGHLGYIKKVIVENDPGDLGLPELWERFMHESYPAELENLQEKDSYWEDKGNLLDKFIKKLDDEEYKRALLFITNQVYDRSFFYGALISSVKGQKYFTQTHKDSEKEYAPDYYLKNKTISFGIYKENVELIKSKGLEYEMSPPFLERGIGEQLIVTFPCSEEQAQLYEDAEFDYRYKEIIDKEEKSHDLFSVKKIIVKDYDLDKNAITTEEGLRERGLPSLTSQKDKDEFLIWLKKRIDDQGFNLENAPLYFRNAYESCDPNTLPPMVYIEWFKDYSK